MSYQNAGLPETRQGCPLPPYNALNFTSANAPIYNTLQSIAHTSPNYPLPQGSDAQQIYRNQQNIVYFNNLNQQTSAIKTQNILMPGNKQPYPQFKSEAERIMYRQGMTMTAARNLFTGENPTVPAGVPCSTIYQIINS